MSFIQSNGLEQRPFPGNWAGSTKIHQIQLGRVGDYRQFIEKAKQIVPSWPEPHGNVEIVGPPIHGGSTSKRDEQVSAVSVAQRSQGARSRGVTKPA